MLQIVNPERGVVQLDPTLWFPTIGTCLSQVPLQLHRCIGEAEGESLVLASEVVGQILETLGKPSELPRWGVRRERAIR